jgi:beta-galactosidase
LKKININKIWKFNKPEEPAVQIDLPHTWNSFDGQNGGNNYYRGKCIYKKTIVAEFEKNQKLFIELEGANSIATVFLNGNQLGTHKGGYSTFRYELTDFIDSGKEADLEIHVDNAQYEDVYPITADFTFMGGLYRDVNLLIVNPFHFNLEDNGSCGIYAHQDKVSKDKAVLRIEALVDFSGDMKPDYLISAKLIDHNGSLIAMNTGNGKDIILEINSPRLWNGVPDPYMYTLEVDLIFCEEVSDSRRIPVGLRNIAIDSSRGIILNGRVLNIKGICRHQDRKDIGWSLGHREMEEDINIIKEMGANSIRLAHYQHNQYFYNLCDKEGIITWAEIPYITITSSEDTTGFNAINQMIELIKQNYNHPSIVIWGLQNEITFSGKDNNVENIVNKLHRLTKSLDQSRLTAQAQVGHHPDDDSMNTITDILGYNKYYGWYYDKTEDMGIWLDNFHKEYPSVPLGITEYGCEAVIRYHNDNPRVSDYSEEYQTKYHHEILQIFTKRPWLWGTFVWNMFDFASDLRNEGGSKGINNKGLVTHDRLVRKDSFYIYQSYWSKQDVLHISSKRYSKREKDKISVSVITNSGNVELLVNGISIGFVSAVKNIARFENVKLKKGENIIIARTKNKSDTAYFELVRKAEESYICTSNTSKPGEEVANWFSGQNDEKELPPLEFPEGFYSIKDKISQILENPEGETVLKKYMAAMFEHSIFGIIKSFPLERRLEMKPDIYNACFIYKLNSELIKVPKSKGDS